MTNKNFI